MWEFTLAKPAAWHSYLFAFLRRLCRTKDVTNALQCLKAVAYAALVLAKKVALPVKRCGYLQRGHGRKPWLGATGAICISLLVECGCLSHQLLVQMADRSVLTGSEGL